MSADTQSSLPNCPFPCGWKGLHKIAVQDAAYLAKVQWPEDEEGVSVPRATAMRCMDYLIQVCRTMLNAAPVAAQPDVTQQTLDDVMAGIPARDAEITALRKETEALRAADPLQGAADWLVNDCGVRYIAELARRLSIGYNRAARLMDVARKEQA